MKPMKSAVAGKDRQKATGSDDSKNPFQARPDGLCQDGKADMILMSEGEGCRPKNQPEPSNETCFQGPAKRLADDVACENLQDE